MGRRLPGSLILGGTTPAGAGRLAVGRHRQPDGVRETKSRRVILHAITSILACYILGARVRFQSPGVARIAEVAQGDPNVRCYSLGAAVSRPLVRGPCAMRARPTEAVSRLRRVR